MSLAPQCYWAGFVKGRKGKLFIFYSFSFFYLLSPYSARLRAPCVCTSNFVQAFPQKSIEHPESKNTGNRGRQLKGKFCFASYEKVKQRVALENEM